MDKLAGQTPFFGGIADERLTGVVDRFARCVGRRFWWPFVLAVFF
jgi:hypothetical protein